jgi:hypothetical protein
MMSLHPTRKERLRDLSTCLHLIYSEDPLTRSDAFAAQVRQLHQMSNGDKKQLPSVRQMCAGIRPDHAVEFIVVCPACGQMFDCRDQDQLEHHSNGKHEPKLH